MNVVLNKRCRIEYKSVAQDANYGTEIITWTLLAVVWCNVQDVLPSKSESVKNDLVIGNKTARLRCRYRTDIESSMRIILDGDTYQIISDYAELGKHEYIEFMIEKYTTS
jgi:SPP1 family predicted phage head-tail adaptor